MEKADFKTYLIAASYRAAKFAEKYVKNRLLYEFSFFVKLNQSHDSHALEENDLYPEDEGCFVECESFDEVVDLLYRKSKIPEWIDINVDSATKDKTYLSLICCGRFTGIQSQLYYTKQGQGPFGVKSPKLPLGYDPKTSKKFKIKKPNRALQATAADAPSFATAT